MLSISLKGCKNENALKIMIELTVFFCQDKTFLQCVGLFCCLSTVT